MRESPAPPGTTSARPNTGVAHNARVWSYRVGGKDNHEADRRVGEQVAGCRSSARWPSNPARPRLAPTGPDRT